MPFRIFRIPRYTKKEHLPTADDPTFGPVSEHRKARLAEKNKRPTSTPPRDPHHWLTITKSDIAKLLQQERNPEPRNKIIVICLGLFLTPITLAGALLGYVRGYKRLMAPHDEYPLFMTMRPAVRLAMVVGALLMWAVFLTVAWLAVTLIGGGKIAAIRFLLAYVAANSVMTFTIWILFRRWRIGINNGLVEGEKFGTARYAKPEELTKWHDPNGIYIGGGLWFQDKGHILTVAGTRGGKGTNLIIPNLLGLGTYKGSWVIIDPKGENAAITARWQRENGQKVVILNPWGLLSDRLGEAQSYNPLDILSDAKDPNLVDDAMIIAEMIVPLSSGAGENAFFTDLARAIINGLLVHLVTIHDMAADKAAHDATYDMKGEGWTTTITSDLPPALPSITMMTIWKWLRLPADAWQTLLADMQCNDHDVFGETIQQSGHEIEKMMAAGDKTWGNIIGTAIQCTDFIKSPALQKSMQSGFDPKDLAGGKTTLYVIIPADKLQSHSRWLRLVTTTTMRAVVRKPNKRVTFLLDEFSALGYLPEIETALSTYAGFEITVWPILQSLSQLQNHYKKTWETFIGNSAVRHFFSVNDNFTAEYVSKSIGQTSYVLVSRGRWGIISKAESNQRYLVTPDELRRGSGENIFMFIADKPVTYFKKQPYYQLDELQARSEGNPYFGQ